MSTVIITASDVKVLRDRTGLGMGDCKQALVEANGDLVLAEKNVREKLKGKMAARSDRAAGEGCMAIVIGNGKAVAVELRSETDFTARNDGFRAMAKAVANLAITQAAGDVVATQAINDLVDDIKITTGENVSFARGVVFEGGNFSSYLHHDAKLAVLMQYEGELLEQTGKEICQHIAGYVPTPMSVDQTGVCPNLIAEKRAEAIAEAAASGKPANIAEKMAEGKMRKFFEEVTLLGQPFVYDEKKQVRELLPKGTTIKAFARLRLGS
ncbi:MAG: translation elongation factor Ts [Phycisphaerales bacterium]|nr:translation elongation factor Ts [Phycisphaerales bacterium]